MLPPISDVTHITLVRCDAVRWGYPPHQFSVTINRQRVHAPPQIVDATCDPNLHASRKRDYCRSTTTRSRASPSGSTPMGTMTRRQFGRVTSTRQSGGELAFIGFACDTETFFGTDAGANDTVPGDPSSPLRYRRRQVVRSVRLMPCRRAVVDA